MKNGVKSRITPEVLAKIRHVTLQAERLMAGTIVGSTRSAIRGMGFDFEALREYQMGDDIRFIDWRASSRSPGMLVREYRVERSKTVLLVLDASGSMDFGFHEKKWDNAAFAAALVALIAQYAHDAVGLLIFSETVEKYIPPARSKEHIQIIIQEIFCHQLKKTTTKSDVASQHLLNMVKQKALVMWFSDCIDDSLQSHLPILARAYQVIVMRYIHEFEKSFPVAGTMLLEDAETEQHAWVSLNVLSRQILQDRVEAFGSWVNKYGITLVDVSHNEESVRALLMLFKKRILQ